MLGNLTFKKFPQKFLLIFRASIKTKAKSFTSIINLKIC